MVVPTIESFSIYFARDSIESVFYLDKLKSLRRPMELSIDKSTHLTSIMFEGQKLGGCKGVFGGRRK
jgi:hypothetical protein